MTQRHPRDMPHGLTVPGYWMNETSGVLRPAVEAYLKGEMMTGEQIAAMRAYLRQWINGTWMECDTLTMLRESVEHLESQFDIACWIEAATDFGADPL